MKLISTLALLLVFSCGLEAVQPLTESSFVEVVNAVNVVGSTGTTQPARKSDIFRAPDLIQTGAGSRAELKAGDGTITRVGANTVFSFQNEGRGINLEKGSILFHSPTGKGGGTVNSKSATASVLGTTIIVATTSNGGFKTLVLEGKARIMLAGGRSMTLKEGQMTFIVPGMTSIPTPIEFRLSKQVEGSGLVGNFKNQLASQQKIAQAENKQEKSIAKGKAEATTMMVGDAKDSKGFQVIDPNTRESKFGQITESASLAENLIIRTSQLDRRYVFKNFFADRFIPGKTLTAVAAKNIVFDTDLIDLSFTTDTDFGFFSLENIVFTQGLQVSGYNGRLIFDSLERIYFASNSLFDFPGGHVVFDSSLLNIDNVAFRDVGGSMDFVSRSSFNFRNGLVNARTVSFTAKGVLDFQNIGFVSGMDSIRMEAATIVLQNINFPAGSKVFLYSALGTLAPFSNTGAAAQPGKVNFTSGVRYGGVAFDSSNSANNSTVTGTTSFVNVYIGTRP